MKWLIVCIIALALSACETAPKVDFEKQALIQVQEGAIIYEIDGKVVYSASSPKAQGVTPGLHEIFVTRWGDIRYDRGVYRLNVAAGLTYQISKDRQSIKVSNSTGAIIDELFLSQNDKKTFVSRDEYQRARQAQRDQLNLHMERQAALAKAERQSKLSRLPQIRKIGAEICQTVMTRGYVAENVVYVGYVERITDDKVQIRISRAHLESRPNVIPGGFSPSIIWDDPMNWDLCK